MEQSWKRKNPEKIKWDEINTHKELLKAKDQKRKIIRKDQREENPYKNTEKEAAKQLSAKEQKPLERKLQKPKNCDQKIKMIYHDEAVVEEQAQQICGNLFILRVKLGHF